MSIDPYEVRPADHKSPPPPDEAPEAPLVPTPDMPEPMCPDCGYIVIGLSRSVCPECGQAVTWRTVIEEPEYRRLLQRTRRFWLGLTLYLGSFAAIAFMTPTPARFFTCASPLLGLSVIWLAFRLLNEDEIRGTLLSFGVLGVAYAVLCWFVI